MKLQTAKPSGVNREPLRTVGELAEELGMTRHQLVWRLTHSPIPAPAPEMKTLGRRTSYSNTWYSPRQVRKWWAECRSHFEKGAA